MQLGFLTDGRVSDMEFAQATGYQCVELALFGDPPSLESLKLWQDSPVPVVAVSLFGQDYFDLATGADRMQRLLKTLEVAEFLGSKFLVFGSGSGAKDAQDALNRLQPVVERAANSEIKLAFYNCPWENIVDRPAEWDKLPEGVGIKFDPSHPVQKGRDWRPELLATEGKLMHAHAKDVLEVGGKFLPDPNPGFGDIRWEQFFGILNAIKYDGAVCVEPHSELYTGERREEFLARSFRYLSQFV